MKDRDELAAKSPVLDEMTKDGAERPKSKPLRAPNPAVAELFESYGGAPTRVHNWHAIALAFLEVVIWALTPFVVKADIDLKELANGPKKDG